MLAFFFIDRFEPNRDSAQYFRLAKRAEKQSRLRTGFVFDVVATYLAIEVAFIRRFGDAGLEGRSPFLDV